MLVAAVAHAEQQLAAGREEHLQAIADPGRRLAAFVDAYLPDDAHDPVWKLWFEGWLRSTSQSEFGEVGSQADERWVDDLTGCLEHLTANGGALPEAAATFARRFLSLLDGLAAHILAGHITTGEATEHAMATLPTLN